MALGEIRLFAGKYAPVGFAICDGALLQIADKRDLFKAIGTSYGGDGRTTFALPDLRGRAPMHRADGAALGTKGNITVDAARTNVDPARVALNFIICVKSGPDQYYEPYVGEVRPFACNFAPVGWARCDGQLLGIMSNTTLFSILETAFGGNGATTFALPNLREAFPFQVAKPEERGTTGGALPDGDGTSPQTPLLVVTYCIAVNGIYPPREG